MRDEAVRREAALQAQLEEARAAAAAATASAAGAGAEGSSLAQLLADKEVELENLQAALGELSYEVRGEGGKVAGVWGVCQVLSLSIPAFVKQGKDGRAHLYGGMGGRWCDVLGGKGARMQDAARRL